MFPRSRLESVRKVRFAKVEERTQTKVACFQVFDSTYRIFDYSVTFWLYLVSLLLLIKEEFVLAKKEYVRYVFLPSPNKAFFPHVHDNKFKLIC